MPHRLLVLGLLTGLLACLPACAQSAEPTPEAEAPVRTAAASTPAAATASADAATDVELDADARPSPSPADLESWHAKTYVATGMGLRLIYYWSKRDWMRAETVISGHPIVTIVRGTDYFGFDRLTMRGIRITRSPEAIAEDAERERPFGNDLAELIAQGAELIEETEESGRAIEVWRITDGDGRRKLWISRDEPRLPIRLETFHRATSEMITTDYADWTVGLPIPDAFFAAPPGIQIEEFDYASYLEAAGTRSIGPVLYPDLLHGGLPR